MLAHLLEVSIRSLLLALPAAFVLWILRAKRTAALQHAVWTAVVCGMLALFAFGQVFPRLPLAVFDTPAATVPALPPASPTLLDETQGAAPSRSPLPSEAPRPIVWMSVGAFAYGAVALLFLAQFATGIFLVRKLVAKSSPEASFLESDRIAVPVTVGWLRPKILLPPEWRQWDREKLDAVLAHEAAHVHRRDGLAAALAAVNRCIFWFHPLAWMLERKLALLAEQACDESCVAALGDRQRYAHLLLEMALVADESQGRLRGHALTMAAASHIRQRIDSLLEEGRTFSRGLTGKSRAAVILCSAPFLFGAGAVELGREPATPQATAQPRPGAPAPKFEVASVKPCKEEAAANRGGRGRAAWITPGGINSPCLPLRLFIGFAYVNPWNQVNQEAGLRLEESGPSWIDSERYQIQAKADGPVGLSIVQGPMLRALLEDRFKLKVHRETKETPVYALTVASGGLKLRRSGDLSCMPPNAGGPARKDRRILALGCSSLKPADEGNCSPKDLTQFPQPRQQPGDKPPCGVLGTFWGPHRLFTTGALDATMAEIAQSIGHAADRPVVDKTGLKDKFDFYLEVTLDGAKPSDDPSAPPSIFAALKKLGLKLEPAKGPRDFIVIDRVERPSKN